MTTPRPISCHVLGGTSGTLEHDEKIGTQCGGSCFHGRHVFVLA